MSTNLIISLEEENYRIPLVSLSLKIAIKAPTEICLFSVKLIFAIIRKALVAEKPVNRDSRTRNGRHRFPLLVSVTFAFPREI